MITNILENKLAIEVLYYLIEQPNRKYSFSQIKEYTKFSNNGIYSAINTLLSYSILIKTKNKLELNSENEDTLTIIELLRNDKKKFKFISTKNFLKIKKIIKFLESKNLEKAYLFGSFAKGNQRLDSDIDIAIFSKVRNDIQEWQFYFNSKNINVEFHQFNKIDKNNELQKNIFRDGILLINKLK